MTERGRDAPVVLVGVLRLGQARLGAHELVGRQAPLLAHHRLAVVHVAQAGGGLLLLLLLLQRAGLHERRLGRLEAAQIGSSESVGGRLWQRAEVGLLQVVVVVLVTLVIVVQFHGVAAAAGAGVAQLGEHGGPMVWLVVDLDIGGVLLAAPVAVKLVRRLLLLQSALAS